MFSSNLQTDKQTISLKQVSAAANETPHRMHRAHRMLRKFIGPVHLYKVDTAVGYRIKCAHT